MEQWLFASYILGIGPLQGPVDAPRPYRWYRPAGKDTLAVCLAALLCEGSSRGMGIERSHAAWRRYRVCTSCRRPGWYTGHTASGSLPAISGVLRSITSGNLLPTQRDGRPNMSTLDGATLTPLTETELVSIELRIDTLNRQALANQG